MARTRNFDPDKYYHVTQQKYVRKILKEGLKPGREVGTSSLSHVYLTKGHLLLNRLMDKDEPLRIIEVDGEGLEFETRPYLYFNEFLARYVPPERLRLLRKSRKRPHVEELEVVKYSIDFETVTYEDGSYSTNQVASKSWTEIERVIWYFT